MYTSKSASAVEPTAKQAAKQVAIAAYDRSLRQIVPGLAGHAPVLAGTTHTFRARVGACLLTWQLLVVR
jgi:hypothetical protein